MDPVTQFAQAMAGAGIPCPRIPVPDGRIHRFSPEGERADNRHAWYVLHGDGIPAGAFGSWKTGYQDTWCARSLDSLNSEELTAHQRRMEAARAQREEERKRATVDAAAKARRIWESAKAEDHPYLVAKQVRAHGVRVTGDKLIIPARNQAGQIQSLQFIGPDGGKRFLRDGLIRGCYHSLGKLTDTLYIVEGYATGASIHEVTGCGVVVAFNAGNLLAVCRAIRSKYPDKHLTVAADNDRWTEGNPGLTKATEAAKAIKAKLCYPSFTDMDSKPTDFNDLYRLEGLGAVRTALEAATRPGRTRSEGKPSKIDRVTAALASGKSLNRFEAARQINDHCLHSTVSAMEKRGIGVARKWEVVPGYQGEPTRVMRYWLDEENQDKARRMVPTLV